ncbi:FKBP-type peptidyl-prolyl cis-trans isomerase [Yersinia enterocolitica]|nr:hypothetical protein [Yersinia enterocolitica]EKN5104026.1 hypothetical protein [Yersinia enterocolitica]
MHRYDKLGVVVYRPRFRSLHMTAMAVCVALGLGCEVAHAQASAGPTMGLPTQAASVSGDTLAPSSAEDVASVVAALQKQIIEQQAMLQALQARLTPPISEKTPATGPNLDVNVALFPPASDDIKGAPVPAVSASSSPTEQIALPMPVTPSDDGASTRQPGQGEKDTSPDATAPINGADSHESGPTGTSVAVSAPDPAVSPAIAGLSLQQPGPAGGETSSTTDGELSGELRLTNEAQRQAYASGVTVWREIENSIASQHVLGIQLDERYVISGLLDMSAHRPLKMQQDDIDHMMANLNGDYIRRANEAKAHQEATGQAYRIAFSKEKGAYSDAGAWYKITDKGQGRRLRTTDMVELSVTGQLPDGSVFDASGQHGQTKTVKVGVLLPAVAIGLQRVSPGGRLTVVIPPGKGYGDTGMPPTIPGGATLIFDITVKGLADNR